MTSFLLKYEGNQLLTHLVDTLAEARMKIYDS